MAIPFPVDIANEIIDHAADDLESLCNLSLTCSKLLPRSRYHLLARYVCLRNESQLNDFYAYLDTNPRMQPVVRCITLIIPWSTKSSKDEVVTGTGNHGHQGLPAMMIPVPLLKMALPNLRYWRFQQSQSDSVLVSFSSSQLASFPSYGSSITIITTLDVSGIRLLNVTEFARFLLPFLGLRSLKLFDVMLYNVGETASQSVVEQLAKQLRLTSLHTDVYDDERWPLIKSLLEIGQSTIEDLVIKTPHLEARNRVEFHELMAKMVALRSITLSMTEFTFDQDTATFVPSVIIVLEIIEGLRASPLHTNTIVYAHGRLNSVLDRRGLVNVERFFLDQPSRSIAFKGEGTKRCRKTFWTSIIGQHFPKLLQQGRLTIQCDESSDSYHILGHDSAVTCLAISSDSRWIASGSSDTTIILWNAHDGNIVREWVAHRNGVTCLAFSPNGHFLASGSDPFVIWDISTGSARIATLDGYTDPLIACAWSPDASVLVLGDLFGTVRIWDVQSFSQLHCFDNKNIQEGIPRFVHLSPDGHWAGFLVLEKCCSIWDTTNGRLHKTFHTDTVFEHASFDPTSMRIVVAAIDYTASIWDFETGARLLTVHGHTKHICDVAFSPSGNWMLSASEDKTVKVWDAHTGNLILSLEGHTGPVRAACFSPDGKYVASASDDKTVRLWRTSDGSCLKTFTEHTCRVEYVLFSPDGETLCSGSLDGTVAVHHLCDISPEDFRQYPLVAGLGSARA